MDLDKDTFVHLAERAVERYENTVAHRQGRLAHYMVLKTRASYTDVLEWIEQGYIDRVFPLFKKKYHEAMRACWPDPEFYNVARTFLAEDKGENYTLDPEFYNWLVKNETME